jgi:hypothetical protein
MNDDEIRRRIDDVRREKQLAGEARHHPETVAAVLRQVALHSAGGAPPSRNRTADCRGAERS